MASHDLFDARDWLAFRKFALREMHRPAVGPDDLGDDPSEDFLKLALLSVIDHMAQTGSLRRADGTAFRVLPAYLDCASPNAFAADRGGLHLCGVHVGLAASFFEFSLFCLSQRRMLRDIGNADAETSPEPIDGYPPGFWMREAGAVLNTDAFTDAARGLLPRDAERYTAAILLTVLMIRFVWLHELYHCVNGHVGWAGARGWVLCFQETGFITQGDLKADSLRALEFDADQSAFHALCRMRGADIENVGGLRRLPVASHLRLSIFAAYATTWIIEECDRRSMVGRSRDHPEPYSRLHNLIRTLASNLAPALDDAKAIHDAVLSELDSLADLLPSFPSGKRLMVDMRQPAFQAGLDRYQDTLVTLRTDLAPFRFL